MLIIWLFRRGRFDRMIEAGIAETVYAYNSMINGQCMFGHLSAAESLFARMINKVQIIWLKHPNFLLKWWKRKSPQMRVSDAKNFVDVLHKQDRKLNEMCYSALLHGYCREGRLVEALSAASEMIQRGINLDLVCHAVLIHGSLKQLDRKTLFGLLKQMQDHGLKPDNVIYTSMIM
ncbi:hypothetical protein HN51_034667 [Arachis hypogaea]